MIYPIHWTASAIADFDSIVDYLMDFDEKAAMRIAQRLIDCANSLAEFPQRGTPIGSDIRQMSLV